MAKSAKTFHKTVIWIVVVSTVACLYTAAGFYLAPYLIRTLAFPRIAHGMDIRISAQSVEVDPFDLTLGLRDFSAKDKAGREIISLGEVSANLDGRTSLEKRKLVFGIRVDAPSVHLERDATGRFNLIKLMPPDDGKPSSLPPFLLTQLAVEHGRIEFKDATGKTPLVASLRDLAITLENLGPEPDRKTHFGFSAKIGEGETVSGQGAFSLGQFQTEGNLELSGVKSASWFNYLVQSSSWKLKSGKVSLKGTYRFRAGTKPVFEIHSTEAQVDDLEAYSSEDKGSWINNAKLSLQGLSYTLADQRVSVAAARIENFASPWLKLANLKSSKLAFNLPENRLELESADAEDADTPWLKIARLRTGKLSHGLADRRLKVESAIAENAATTWLKVSKLSTEKWSYDLNEETLNLKALSMHEAVADMKADGEPLAAIENSPLAAYGSNATKLVAVKSIARAVRIGVINAADVSCSFRQRSLSLVTLLTEGGEINTRRTAEGMLQISGLPNFAAGAVDHPESAKPWKVQVGDFWLNNYAVGLLDQSVEPPVRLSFAPAALRMKDFTTEGNRQFQYWLDSVVDEKGKIGVEGQAQLSPLRSELSFRADGVRLRSLQPYWKRLVGFDLGRAKLDLWGRLAVRQDKDFSFDYNGAARIASLVAVDRQNGSDLIRWKSLNFDGLDVGTSPRRVNVRRVTAEEPYTRVLIFQDGGLNLARDLLAAAPNNKPIGEPKARTAPTASWPVTIGDVQVKNGLMDFMDQTLKPHFAAKIENLNGNIRGLSSGENAKSDVLMEGVINRSSPVKIYGQATPVRLAEHTDITMQFKALSLPALSPYSAKFAGYRIEKGKLDMDLHYKLEHRRLESSNRMVLDQLTLGERVDSPSATTLPVDFAVALLKDSDGRIDIDLPVSGNLDDPQFSLGSLYARAAEEMLFKLVNSPFAILRSLTRSSDEELDYVTFRPGDASLAGDDKSKLSKVVEALTKRPSLNLNIKAFADPEQDRMALAESALRKRLRDDRVAELRAKGQRIAHADRDKLELSDEDYRRLFTRYYRQKHPEEAGILTGKIGSEPVLAGSVFDQAKKKTLEQWPVSDLELRTLARNRGLNIRDYMVGEAGLPAQRIYLLDVNLTPTQSGEIKVLLTLSGT